METTLVAVTLVSLTLASAMSFVAWRLLMQERRREAAHIAALVDLARQDDDLELQPAPSTTGSFLHVSRPVSRAPEVSQPPEVALGDLFSSGEQESPAGRRLVAAAAVAAVMAAGVGAMLFARGASGSAGATAADATAASPTTGTAVASAAVPLELVSLRHERDGQRLTITGLVRNPRHGARVDRTSAVAFVFDPAGTFIASGRALVDFTVLGPGDESPFVVTVIAPGKIGRYRIGFRGQDGAVVNHVDRRATP